MRIMKIPQGERASSLFTAEINGIPAVPAFARVSAMPFNRVWPDHQRDVSQTEEAAFLSFSMAEPAKLTLTASKDFENVTVRPLSAGIVPTVKGREISFTLQQTGQYSVELDGLHSPLFIFADPETDFGVSRGDDVIYYGAGVHEAGCIELSDGQTLCIDRDAVVHGYVRAIGARNIRIVGNGILDGSRAVRTDASMLVPQDIFRRNPDHDRFSPQLVTVPCASPNIRGTKILSDRESYRALLEAWNLVESPIQLYDYESIEIGGIILRDSVGFTCIAANCRNVRIDNIKLVGMWRYNSDGIDLFNSQNCTIRNCFLRNFDDCVVLKGIPGWDTENMENILVESCVLWCDWGRALEIGAETSADEYRNIVFRNCDIIHASIVSLDIQNCDRASIHDVRFEDIRVEYSKCDLAHEMQKTEDSIYTEKHGEAALIYCGYGYTYYSIEKQKGRIYDITFKNISVLTDVEGFTPRISIRPFDEVHDIQNVKIEGLTVNGKPYERE